MPTIEFYGFSADEQQRLVQSLVEQYGQLEFSDDIVMVIDDSPTRRVLRLRGGEAPFVRIASRSEARLRRLVEVTTPFCDVETLIIGFHERLKES